METVDKIAPAVRKTKEQIAQKMQSTQALSAQEIGWMLWNMIENQVNIAAAVDRLTALLTVHCAESDPESDNKALWMEAKKTAVRWATGVGIVLVGYIILAAVNAGFHLPLP